MAKIALKASRRGGWIEVGYVMRRGVFAVCATAAALLSLAPAASSQAPNIGPDSNLPVPRFVSLKTEGANGRRGPGLEHRIDWIYARAGLPLQVTAESGPWRRVRDPDGAQVWMHAQNLGPERTVYVRENLTLRRTASAQGSAIAYLAPGVVAALTACAGEWRRLAVRGRVGWAPAAALWGGDDCAGI